MVQIRDFTVPELDKFRELCNFTPQERLYFDSTLKELNDILPSYLDYINIKRRYQMKETTIDNVLIQLNNVCNEIGEFLKTLYASTDTQEERDYIHKLINYLKEAF